ncbi:UTRA domain-containing protein, partial [Pseudomonas aeruginosa]
ERLRVEEGSPVCEIKRVRLVNREPVSLEVTYLPQALGEHRVDGQVGMAEGNAAIVLEDQEDVAGHQVGLLQALAE